MKQITDQQRIEACKVLGVCSAVSDLGFVVISRKPMVLRKIAGAAFEAPAYEIWDDPHRIVFVASAQVTDCPDWRKSARDENGEEVA